MVGGRIRDGRDYYYDDIWFIIIITIYNDKNINGKLSIYYLFNDICHFRGRPGWSGGEGISLLIMIDDDDDDMMMMI